MPFLAPEGAVITGRSLGSVDLKERVGKVKKMIKQNSLGLVMKVNRPCVFLSANNVLYLVFLFVNMIIICMNVLIYSCC